MENEKNMLPWAGAQFDVEHALNMYANSYCALPAFAIYEKELLEQFQSVIDSCHIYLIGFLPKIILLSAKQEGEVLVVRFGVCEKNHELKFQLPPNCKLVLENERYFLEGENGDRYWPNEEFMVRHLSRQTGEVNFEVKYIGQAYGQDGSRDALDRLLKHETLQKISIKGIPEGYDLSLLLLEVVPANRMLTIFNPFAENSDDKGDRIRAGLEKLYETTEQERIALYEAALIRYFYPEFNKKFKDSFPSTNQKILAEAYKKDMAAIIAEIAIDALPFNLYSSSVESSLYHVAKFDLHDDERRKAFFGLD